MDNERPNERILWSHRLEEPGALPGVGLTDKEATWDKLYEKLRETPRHRTLPWWLWAAAACILLTLVPAAILLKDRSLPGPNQPQISPVPKSAPSEVAQSTLSVSPPAGIPPRITPHSARRENRERRTPVKQTIQTLAPVVSKAPSPSPQTLPGSVLPPLPDPVGPVAAIQPAKPKKELRVIHINELEPPQPAPATAGPRLKPGRLYIGFNAGQDIFRPATTYETYHTDHPIISFKHTTPNP